MAKIKVKGVERAVKNIKKIVEKNAVKGMLRSAQTIENEIIVTILRGKSPVKGETFKQYSEDYANRAKGGNRKPVNMKVSGDMLDSLQVKKVKGKNAVSILFKSKIAAFHDILGAGRSKVIRRLLPKTDKGETFKSNIIREIIKAISKAIK